MLTNNNKIGIMFKNVVKGIYSSKANHIKEWVICLITIIL